MGHVCLPGGRGRTLVRGLPLALPGQSGEPWCENAGDIAGCAGHSGAIQQLCTCAAVQGPDAGL